MQSSVSITVPGVFSDVAKGHRFLAAKADEYQIPLSILNLVGPRRTNDGISPFRVRSTARGIYVRALGLDATKILFQARESIHAALQSSFPNVGPLNFSCLPFPPSLREGRYPSTYRIPRFFFARRQSAVRAWDEWKRDRGESTWLREHIAEVIVAGVSRQLEEIFDSEPPEDFFIRPEDVRVENVFCPLREEKVRGKIAAAVSFDTYFRFSGEWAAGRYLSKGFGQILNSRF